MKSTIRTTRPIRLRVERRPEIDLDKLAVALLRLARERGAAKETRRG